MEQKTITMIADAGSTGTEWIFIRPDGWSRRYTTAGINPVHLTASEIAGRLEEIPALAGSENIREIWFYGAGCIPQKQGVVREMLRQKFGTDRIWVESDLLGAARALCGDAPGIACILGTGSNSALYDGARIAEQVPPLGYILGDEGSGAAMGKKLIGDLLKGLFPAELAEAFYRAYPLTYPEIIEAVYRQPAASRFLAQFAPFIHQQMGHPAMRELVEEAFGAFTERNLLAYEGVKELPVSFVGSIAYYFEPQLRQVLARYGLRVGKVERSPMAGLVEYHLHQSL